MSKESGFKDEGRRRRRKGAGLRVPSDNVPRRRGSSSDSTPPDDSGAMASSVAVAYEGAEIDTDESAAVMRTVEMTVDELADAVDESVGMGEASGETTLVGHPPMLVSDTVIDGPPTPEPGASPGDSTGSSNGSYVRPDTEETDPAASLDDPPTEVMVPALADAGEDAGGESEDDGDQRAAGDSAEAADSDDEVLPSGDSVDIPFDEEEEVTVTAEVAGQAVISEDDAQLASQPAQEEAGADDAVSAAEQADRLEPEAEAQSVAAMATTGAGGESAPTADATDVPAEASADEPDPEPAAPSVDEGARPAGQKKPKFIRAQTMALSDADLEEVEPEELAPDDLVEEDGPAPLEPHDSGESGEIIADDMIEEIDGGPADGGAVVASSSEAEASEGRETGQGEVAPPPPPTKPKGASPPPAPARAAAVAAAAAPAARAKRRKGKPWFDEIFDEDYLRTLPFLTPMATQAEANFVIESLGVEPGAQVLDVACGYGRHAMELAARGYHVVGLDSSLSLLLRGADEAQRRGLTINFVHGDMREMNFESQFDGAYCLFSSFGYFDDETNKKTAQNVARALKPGARFVVEVLNRDYLVADLPSRVWWEGDGCVVLEEVEFNYFSSRIVSNRSVVFDDGRQLEQEISLRSFSLHELGKLLHAAGFRVLEISGSMATRGRFFGAHSRDIVVVAELREAGPADAKA